jgi:hypothetical protein
MRSLCSKSGRDEQQLVRIIYAVEHGGLTIIGQVTGLNDSTFQINGHDSELVLDLASALSFDYKESREAAEDVPTGTRNEYPSVIEITFPNKVRGSTRNLGIRALESRPIPRIFTLSSRPADVYCIRRFLKGLDREQELDRVCRGFTKTAEGVYCYDAWPTSTEELVEMQKYGLVRTILEKTDEDLTKKKGLAKVSTTVRINNSKRQLGRQADKNMDTAIKNHVRIDKSAKALDLIFPIGRRVEELFLQQLHRLVFHDSQSENDYHIQKKRLSILMLDESLSNEKHMEYAREIIALADVYIERSVRPLQRLNDEIQEELRKFEQVLSTIPDQEENLAKDLQRWLSLSKELQLARLKAETSIIEQMESDRWLPKEIIKNGGRADMTFSQEDSARIKEALASNATLMKDSYESNERIQQEREPLAERLFPINDKATATQETQPNVTAQKTPRFIHPLQGKVWFRLLKVLYIVVWIVGLGLSALLGYVADDLSVFLGAGAVVVVSLIVLQKVFYYVVLGRTTATERPGRGFVDSDELRNRFAVIQANDASCYEEVIAPFLQAWEKQYGRRIPQHAVELLQKRIDQELESIKQKRREIIKNGASEGKTIDIASLRERYEKGKAEYNGPNRKDFVWTIDKFVLSLEVKYGNSIPVDEALVLMETLEEQIRASEKVQDTPR